MNFCKAPLNSSQGPRCRDPAPPYPARAFLSISHDEVSQETALTSIARRPLHSCRSGDTHHDIISQPNNNNVVLPFSALCMPSRKSPAIVSPLRDSNPKDKRPLRFLKGSRRQHTPPGISLIVLIILKYWNPCLSSCVVSYNRTYI